MNVNLLNITDYQKDGYNAGEKNEILRKHVSDQ